MIQLNLFFETENEILPRDFDKLMVSFIKSSIKNESEELFNSFYNNGKPVMKPFTFSLYLPGAKFTENNVILGKNNFSLFLSSPNLAIIIKLMNAFKKMKKKKYPINRNSMTLMSLGTSNLKEIKDSEIIVKMSSSLIVRKHNKNTNKDIYYSFDDVEFAETLKANTDFFVKNMGYDVSTEGFEIEAVKGKKIVATSFDNKINASIGIYKLKGKPELLNLLYLSGIGSRRSEGHGKFEIIL